MLTQNSINTRKTDKQKKKTILQKYFFKIKEIIKNSNWHDKIILKASELWKNLILPFLKHCTYYIFWKVSEPYFWQWVIKFQSTVFLDCKEVDLNKNMISFIFRGLFQFQFACCYYCCCLFVCSEVNA